jgi:4,5-dihydroxyphthalate decarboxylase
VGVNRGYTVTTGLWARSILQDEHGVDLSKITWVLSGDEHVQEYRPPANVVSIENGKTLANLLTAGELAAAIGVEVDHPDVQPLIPDGQAAGLDALRHRGHYPINHLIVVKDDVLKDRPELALDAFTAFTEAKRIYLERLKAGTIAKPTDVDQLHSRVMAVTGDPLPYGLEPNRRVLDELVSHALTQGIITRRPPLEELFPSSTLGLVG